MNDIRRTILWVIFGFSMVLLWDKWQVHNGHKALFFPAPASSASPPAAEKAATLPTGGAASVPVATAVQAGAAAVPGVAAQAAAPVRREPVEISTDVLRLRFDSEGGSLIHAELLQHVDLVDRSKHFVLLDDSAQRVYMAQTGLIGGGFPTHKTVMNVVPASAASSS